MTLEQAQALLDSVRVDNLSTTEIEELNKVNDAELSILLSDIGIAYFLRKSDNKLLTNDQWAKYHSIEFAKGLHSGDITQAAWVGGQWVSTN